MNVFYSSLNRVSHTNVFINLNIKKINRIKFARAIILILLSRPKAILCHEANTQKTV